MREKVMTLLDGLEEWIRPFVNPPQDSGMILSLYKTVGSMIRFIAPLIYCKVCALYIYIALMKHGFKSR